MAQKRLTLLLILAVFALPPLAAWLAHRWWQPTRFSNYGELIEPTSFQPADLKTPAGAPFALSALAGRWVMVQIAGTDCDAVCARSLYLAHQAHVAQGPDQERIRRLLLARANVPVSGVGAEGLEVAVQTGAETLPAPGLYLLDPRGRLMMRYPQPPDGKGLIKDLHRLLKASRIG